MYRTLPKKLMYRPRAGTPRAKWLEELKLEKELKVTTQFTERNIGKCYQTAVKQFFLKEYPIIIT
jgi:hypothetical protein